ncbi:hypothetical protein [Streptomyces bobili]|uniref:hypothetical protein n=1 Tax=Streptomyces bobili TaxID=67280 RepID=UPI0037A65999
MVEWESGTLAVERLQGRLQRHGAGAVLKLEISKLAVEVPFTPDDLAAFAAARFDYVLANRDVHLPPGPPAAARPERFGQVQGPGTAAAVPLRRQPPPQPLVHIWRFGTHHALDASCESWGRFLDEYEHVSSVRGDDHFATMRTDLAPYTKTRAVRELAGRAREVAVAKA